MSVCQLKRQARESRGPFFTHKFGNQIQVWKHAKYLVKQIGPLTPQQQQQTFGLRNFHHHHDTLDKSKAIYNGAKIFFGENWPNGQLA